jgi:uncharacterized membrane protein
MIVSWRSSDSSRVSILTRGNFSLGAGGLVNLLLALAVVSLCLAGLLALQGYRPILLIAFIQLVLVAWVLIRAWERTRSRLVQPWCFTEIRVAGFRIGFVSYQ